MDEVNHWAIKACEELIKRINATKVIDTDDGDNQGMMEVSMLRTKRTTAKMATLARLAPQLMLMGQ